MPKKAVFMQMMAKFFHKFNKEHVRRHRVVIVILFIFLSALSVMMSGGTDLHFHKKDEGDRIRIACVGDSITNGALIPGCFFRSYPAQLQRMLGDEYHVENFGLNDRTLQSTGNRPYCSGKEFSRSLEFKPDVVVIMLGTNDTKSINWQSQEHFIAEYKALLKAYAALESTLRIVLCAPPWATDAAGALEKITNDISAGMLPEIADAVRKTGAECGLPVVDMYSEFEGRRDLLSYDGVHPNAKGAAVIALGVYNSCMKAGPDRT